MAPIMEGWPNSLLIAENCAKVRRVIEHFKPDTLNIFSFAIWNTRERMMFDMYLRERLERVLGMKLSLVLTVDDDITPVCCRMQNISPETVDFNEMTAFWNKQMSFPLCMRNHATNMARHNHRIHSILLDDVVYNATIKWPDLGSTVEMWNIDQLFVSYDPTN